MLAIHLTSTVTDSFHLCLGTVLIFETPAAKNDPRACGRILDKAWGLEVLWELQRFEDRTVAHYWEPETARVILRSIVDRALHISPAQDTETMAILQSDVGIWLEEMMRSRILEKLEKTLRDLGETNPEAYRQAQFFFPSTNDAPQGSGNGGNLNGRWRCTQSSEKPTESLGFLASLAMTTALFFSNRPI